MLAPEYSIDGVELVMYGGHTRTITPLERAESGFGVSLNQAIKPPDKSKCLFVNYVLHILLASQVHDGFMFLYMYCTYRYYICFLLYMHMYTCNY